MIKTDEDALICDLAETYQIFDYKSLPVRLVAILSCGLKADSRIKLKLSNSKISVDMGLRALMVDALNLLVWMKTKDAQSGRNKPASIFENMTETVIENKTSNTNKIDAMVFDSIEEYEKFKKGAL